MRKIVLTEEMKAYINENRLNMSVKEMADALEVNKQTVRSYLNRFKLDYKICAKKYRQDLTNRETEIMALIADGLSNKEILDRLVITQSTFNTHLSNIYTKYNLLKYPKSSHRIKAVLKFQQEKESKHIC